MYTVHWCTHHRCGGVLVCTMCWYFFKLCAVTGVPVYTVHTVYTVRWFTLCTGVPCAPVLVCWCTSEHRIHFVQYVQVYRSTGVQCTQCTGVHYVLAHNVCTEAAGGRNGSGSTSVRHRARTNCAPRAPAVCRRSARTHSAHCIKRRTYQTEGAVSCVRYSARCVCARAVSAVTMTVSRQ